ncbi:DUF2442 domain-containing protein [Rhodoplanes sp. TEM]|uniref:DUF2442 domain-containing protein n=1 Tax=Rhodoplanes tepidamans TaxID=200616 RepID=A0ABT5JJQ0_RHOTP|nr:MULTISPECIES: DUF2442 domain-containing protein [Rhodoplanes]MDC7789809.1 DUF2442 domain-containing protein [Rhodoplanes tepidamans]MDC7985556.1 DUF2442 domain-containing protein [Rhodoplanes sp. TEM]MDQ0355284.1 hypothetical protein [Rhodoplanes tepidamans]
MNGAASTNDEVVRVGPALPRIAAATPLDGRKVAVTWRSGETRIVDLAPALESRRIYIPLRADDALFRTLRVSAHGDAIEWDGGLDVSAIWLDRLPPVAFDNADFRRAMDDLDMTLDGMAAQLEVSRRLVAGYRKDKPIPRHIALAVRYLVERQHRSR